MPTKLENGKTLWHSDEQLMLGIPRDEEPTIQTGSPYPDTLDDDDTLDEPPARTIEQVMAPVIRLA